jgi:hypothetical protein
MAKKFYVVEHDFLYGWDDAGWLLEGKPWRFDTSEEALAEIRALCADTGYNPEEYRVVEDKNNG